MKIIYACLMMLLLTAVPLFAQDQPPSAEDIVAKMQAGLNLTQDQVSAITPIIEKYSSKREELRQGMEDGTADKDSIRIQMKELRANEKQELAQVLSADQLSLWEKMQGHKHGNGAPWGAGSNNGEHGAEGGGNGS